eukprot:CAMPEP_0116855682 /NCGR_PEP_ID=MMETSP0418-20121206/19433_1 /TAXON_ID=1158023 /ORGANISM="Astrosyne radiata, Strain 13vi08-1A" /LENGTH=227 /DNA_ID=CAMNT_0004488881 /DNA_START=163 /DNA_END=842 /DNA_ORIENTATION=+
MLSRWNCLFAALCLLCHVDGYLVGSYASGFAGKMVVSTGTCNEATLQMKKQGFGGAARRMRKDQQKKAQINEMRKSMLQNMSDNGGLPVFNLFVKSPVGQWYPCGGLKGDEKSKGLVEAYRDKGMMQGLSKKQLDNGMAQNLFENQEKLKDQITKSFAGLKDKKDSLIFGYRITYEGIPADDPITIVEPKEMKGIVDNINFVKSPVGVSLFHFSSFHDLCMDFIVGA